MSKVKLFFIPYSGASSMIYNRWKNNLNDSIIFSPVEFPARGRRFKDQLCTSAEELIEDLYKQVKNELDDYPYAFFGHCIGGALAFELAHKIKEDIGTDPVHMFFSGRQVPHIEYKKSVSTMTEEKFMNEVIGLQNNLKQIYKEKALREIYIPIFKADLLMSETYSHLYDSDKSKLNCDITVLSGRQDEYVSLEDIAEWPNYTYKTCNYNMFEGGHFFIHNNMELITEIINNTLC